VPQLVRRQGDCLSHLYTQPALLYRQRRLSGSLLGLSVAAAVAAAAAVEAVGAAVVVLLVV
jgi:hypothetical protein